jgi:acetolactate synthase-1/2/3 large subunit
VVLALPEDMLAETADVADAAPYIEAQPAATPEQIAALRELLARARQPLMIVGGSGWSEEACVEIVAFAEASGLPAACSFRRMDVFDNRSDCFVGDLSTSVSPALSRRVKEADLLLLVGARLGEWNRPTRANDWSTSIPIRMRLAACSRRRWRSRRAPVRSPPRRQG